MRKGLLIAGGAVWLIAVATATARADTCETFPGSQQYTDQGCDKPYDNGGGKPSGAAPARPAPTSDLRETLRRALANQPGRAGGGKASPAALANAVANARDGVTRALGEAAAASDPNELAKARRDYNAAMARLDRAYDAAANAASPQGGAELLDMKNRDDASFASAGDRLGLFAPPAAPPAAAAAPSLPTNITAVNGMVYVCDKPIADGNNVSCREIAADGRQCTNVTLADGAMGWRDSIATPCRADDLAQRQAFLAANPDIAAQVSGTPAFTMGNASIGDDMARSAAAGMSNACLGIVQNYIRAAQDKDGPAAAAQYEALKNAGGCGVLQQVDSPPPPAADPRFISRGGTPMLDQTFGACDRQPELCNQIADQLKAGTSPEAIAALYNHAIGVGLELGAMMGGAVLNAQAARMPRGPTAQYPRAISCNYSGCRTTNGSAPAAMRGSGPPANYPAPRPSRGNNCTMDANNWLTCK